MLLNRPIGLFMKKNYSLLLLTISLFCSLFCKAQSGNIYTMAGTGVAGFAGDGALATAAKLNDPTDVFKDAAGNYYIADRNNHRVRKINTAGIISTIAGTGTAGYSGDGGLATLAKLDHPNGVAVDATGNIYIADESNNVIRMINTAGIISTVAGTGAAGFSGDGGVATSARLNDPQAVAKDLSGNIYIADNNNSRVRMINPSGIISTIAGGTGPAFTVDGVPATSVSLCNIHDVSVDNAGNIYFTNQGCWHFLRITGGLLYDEAGAVAASYTGDCGPADSADVQSPYGIYPDNLGNVYLCPRGNKRVRKVNTANYITTVAGTGVTGYSGDGGPALSATVSSTIYGVYADLSGDVYFADAGNNVIRYFHSSSTDTVPVAVCFGAADTLRDSSSYGAWVSSNTGVATVGSISGIITGISSGTALISFTNAACPQNFIVTISLANVAGAEICQGATAILTDSTAGGTWSSGDDLIATIGSGTGMVTGVSTGIDPITYIMPSGCTATGNVTVDVTPGPISGSTSVCAGSTITLSDAVGGVSWSSSNVAVATIGTDGTVTGVAAGTTTITCFVVSCYTTLIITVNPLPNAGAITGTLTVCPAATTPLTDATGDAGGVWSSVTTTVATIDATGLVSGVATGTSTVSYTVTNGCGTAAATVVVTVDPLPDAGAITGILTVCPGATTPLSDATGDAGGVWSSVTTTVATISATGIVSGVASGTSVISYTVTNFCGASAATAIVTVNPSPNTGAITGVLTVCPGATTQLTDATGDAGGTWSSVTTTVATISSTGLVSGIALGTSIISYTVTNSCGTAAATAVVTVNALPNAGAVNGTLTVCPAATTPLSDPTGDAGGVWSSVTTTVATISATGLVSGVATGTSLISYTVTNSCGTAAATAIVTVNPLPDAGAVTGTFTVCPGATTTVSDATGDPGGVWSSVTTTIATISSAGVVTGVATGTTIISYTVTNSCGTAAATAIVTVNPEPNAGAITGTLTVCPGSTTPLADATGDAGGTWSSVTTTVATIDATGLVTGVATGTSIISYTVTNSCGTAAATAIVTVNLVPNAGAITGVLTVCPGATTPLTDATGDAGGTWSSVTTTVATVSATGVVTGVAQGTSTISYLVTNVCSTAVATAIVTVNPLPNAGAITGTFTVCPGATTNLTDLTGDTGGTWSSSAIIIATVGSTGVVTGVLAGTSRISYKVTNSCGTASATAVVTVNAFPNAGFILGTLTVCPGSTTSLSDAFGTAGGTWSSVTTTVATVAATGIVTGVASGTSTISYTVTNVCGTRAATAVVTVNAAPTPVITPLGDTTFCPGSFVVLTANPGAGLSYQWYVGGVAISGALSSEYIAATGGSYQVSETLSADGCAATSIPMLVTVDNPVATISTTGGITTMCAGSSITLNANIGIGFTYQWLLGGIAIPGAVASSYATTLAGDYSVIVTNSTGCSATSAVITLSINPSPTANIVLSGPITFCQGGSVMMTTDYAADNTYQWYNAAGAIPGANGLSYTATTTGGYYVIVTNGFGCSATSVTTNVVANPLPNVAITKSGPAIFCAGGSITLSVVTGGYAYQWFVDGSPIAGATNVSFLATTGGGYRVEVTDLTTGCKDETHADTVITVVGTPVIIPITSASFCWGSSSLLSTSVSGATGTVIYQWYFNGAIIPGATGAIYNATISGNYSCQITIPGSCTATTVDLPVTEFPLPDPVVYFNGAIFYTSTYYVTYQWYKNMSMIPGATTSSTLSTGAGDYKVAVTDTNGCQSFSDAYIYTGAGSTGVKNISKGGVEIFPNPAADELTISMDMGAYGDFTVTNNLGQQLMQQKIMSAQTKVDLVNLPAGVYYITFIGDSGTEVKKFVKL